MASKVRGCKSFTQAVISQETFQLSTFPPILMDLRKYISPICGRAMIWPCGPTDKASDYKSGDCRFESCQGHNFWAPIILLAGDKNAPPGGLEPPTFRLTAERASRLRHGGGLSCQAKIWVVTMLMAKSSRKRKAGSRVKKKKKLRRGWDSNPRGQSPLD